jgi:hypothetical protein
MLFILIMEVLSTLIRAADSQALHHCNADDLIMFLKPTQRDLKLLRGIFDLF